MASIRKETVLGAPADIVWDALRDIGALHTRLVPGFVTDTKLEPGARVVTFSNGQVVRELIVEISEVDRRIVWAIVDSPFQHYNASAQVFSELHECSRFVWVADLLPNKLKDHIAMMMDHGLEAITTVFGGPGQDKVP